jgi:outer membrane protein assembly factor BamB
VFVVTLANELFALERNTGKVAWSLNIPGEKGEYWAGPTLAGGNLWLGSNKGRLITVSAANGSVVATRSVGEPVFVPPIVVQGSLIVMSGRGSLTATQ